MHTLPSSLAALSSQSSAQKTLKIKTWTCTAQLTRESTWTSIDVSCKLILSLRSCLLEYLTEIEGYDEIETSSDGGFSDYDEVGNYGGYGSAGRVNRVIKVKRGEQRIDIVEAKSAVRFRGTLITKC